MATGTDADAAALQRIHNRLESTPNEQLEGVLTTLLPKLIPFAQQEALRDKHIIPIFAHVLRRIKLLKTVLPAVALVRLVRPDMMPFGCNFSVAFLDTVAEWLPAEQWLACGGALVEGLGAFAPFSAQSNALCHYALFSLSAVADATSSSSSSTNGTGGARDILGDFFLDVAFTQPGLVKGSAGSIQPGLSVDRVDRLTAKRKEWAASAVKPFKLTLIASLPKAWLPTECAVAIAIVASCDADPDVATQAAFKMNGARSLLPDVKDRPGPVLDLLLKLCLPLTQSMAAFQAQPYLRQRTTVREAVKIAILHWVAKEMRDHLPLASAAIVQVLFSPRLDAAKGLTNPSSLSHFRLLVRTARLH